MALVFFGYNKRPIRLSTTVQTHLFTCLFFFMAFILSWGVQHGNKTSLGCLGMQSKYLLFPLPLSEFPLLDSPLGGFGS